mgnify:FL=1
MKECNTIKLTDSAVYIELNDWVYYIDDTTGEQIMDKWRKPNSYPLPLGAITCCVCKTAEGDVDELLVEGWVTFCNPCLDEIARLEGDA